jgi:hypothetical protein
MCTCRDRGSPLVEVREGKFGLIDDGELADSAQLGPAEVGAHRLGDLLVHLLNAADHALQLAPAPLDRARVAGAERLVHLAEQWREVQRLGDVVLVLGAGGREAVLRGRDGEGGHGSFLVWVLTRGRERERGREGGRERARVRVRARAHREKKAHRRSCHADGPGCEVAPWRVVSLHAVFKLPAALVNQSDN